LSDLNGLRNSDWYNQSFWGAHPHPAIVAVLFLLLSVLALLAFTPEPGLENRPVPPKGWHRGQVLQHRNARFAERSVS
jgi:hypothetical protein